MELPPKLKSGSNEMLKIVEVSYELVGSVQFQPFIAAPSLDISISLAFLFCFLQFLLAAFLFLLGIAFSLSLF
ncbi:hypothetical protein O6P43_031978 [Quillaja saponaria]|uniref:Uncharacterized protein n=1 Tax=Quillaja saponaria TaxID=32244 RepID=A0AAD7KWI2_QUISA|nr:hypothetical protein O6P43_031978 [Quillaja saponaria]